MKRKILIAVIVLIGLAHINLSAQDMEDKVEVNLSDYYVDLSIPDNGIANLLQVELTQVKSLNNLKDFAFQVFNGQDEESSNGIGAEFSLDRFISKEERTLSNYRYGAMRGERKYKTFKNIRPLVGISESDLGLNVAVGININLFNKADYYARGTSDIELSNLLNEYSELELTQSFQSRLTAFTKAANKSEVTVLVGNTFDTERDSLITDEKFKEVIDKLNALPELRNKRLWQERLTQLKKDFNAFIRSKPEANKSLNKKIDDFKDEFNQKNWNAAFLTINAGILWNSEDKTVANLMSKKWQFSLAGAFDPGDSKNAQFLYTLRFSGNIEGKTLINPEDQNNKEEQGAYFLGGRYLVKLNKTNAPMTANVFLEAGATRTTYFNREIKDEVSGVLGLEAKILEGTWIQTGLGFKGNEANFQGDFKYTFTEKSRF